MERTMSATEARIHFGELMRRVTEDGDRVIVERAGKPHVVVLSVSEYEALVASQRDGHDWRELVQQARARIRADLGGGELTPPPEDVIRRMREERSAQLTDLR